MSLNYVEALVDEIALEGLDGITLQALWVRLQHRKNFDFFLDDSSKNFLWNIVKKLRNIEIFILPKARPDLVLPNGEDDPEVILVSVQMQMKQLYPHCLVDIENIKGSCPTFEKRIPAPETILSLSAEECQKEWGGRLVLVASQETRTAALIGSSKHPFFEMATIQYCVLERIGRSRHFGVLTYGPGSIQDVIKEDPRSHFYMRKKFLEHELITKQFQSVSTKSGTNNCYVLHLTRFHCLMKSKTKLREEAILSFLKKAPDHFLPLDQLKSKLDIPPGVFKKLVTAMHNKGILDTHSSVTYRTLHPDAKPYQWQSKNTGLEKSIRVIRLMEGATEKHGEEEVQIGEETLNSDDEGDDEEMEGETSTRGLLDISKRTLDRSLTHQAYKILEDAGSEGLTQRCLGEILGLGKLDSRMICKLLLREGIVTVKMQDVGRQRVTRYIAIRVQEKDMKFEAEKQKFLDMVGDPKVLERLLLREQRNPFSLVRQLREDAEELFDTPKEVEDIEGNLQDVKLGATITAEHSQTQETDELAETDDTVDPLDITDLKTNNGHLSTKAEDESLMTYRSLRRINIILAHIFQHKIVDDLCKFYKVIHDAEKEEGYEYKIDRRSLHRLIAKLQQEKCIKLFKAVVKSDEKKRTLIFVCSPDTERDHSSIQGAIEQAKFRVFNVPLHEVKPPKENVALEMDPLLNQESIILSMQEIQKLNIEANANTLAVKALEKEKSNCYGHCPKFVRMRLLHKLLFYLTRSYQGKVDLDQTEVIQSLQSMGHHDLPQDLPKVYKLDDHVNWKMFIPPLPNHEGWPQGWTILSDIVLRVPLSIFVRIMWVRYVVPGLDGYLNHPIKQHYLLGHLPRSIRSALLANRKFVFSLFETAQRLCFMGLLQFGPQRLKEKDQLFVYVNLNASIFDTTPSDIGYFQISTNIEYEKKAYSFSSIEELEKYWCDLYTTSVCTQLGGKAGQEGKEIILEALENKPALLEACTPRTAADVELHDTGSIPGDHLGASGLDSAFFSHLKRNWNSKYIVLNSSTQPREQRAMEWEANFNPEVIELGTAEVVPSTSQKSPPPTAETRPLTSCNVKKKTTFLKEPRKKERKIITRKLQKPNFKKKIQKKVAPALGTLPERCSWSTEEDVYLILCKIASMYLSQESHKTLIKNELITRILMKHAPSSKPKDGLRYLRRMNFLFNRSPSAQRDMAFCLEECRQDTQITEKYLNFRQNLKAKKLSVEQFEAEMDKGFEELVDTLKQKYKSFSDDMLLDTPIPDTLEEFHATYSVVNPLLSLRNRGKYNEPKTLEQVYFNTIIALILSSMGTSADKTNYSFQLLNVYQQFPDKWLRNAIHKLRNDQMVSSKKLFSRALKYKNSHIPLTSSPFQLSVYYYHMMQSKFQYELFHEAWNALQGMHGSASSSIMLDPLADAGGRTACIFEGSATGLISMDVEMPAQIIILEFDTSIDDEEKKCLEEYYEKIINTDKLETESEPETAVGAQKRTLELEDTDAPDAKRRKCDDVSDKETTEKTPECAVIEDKAVSPQPNLIVPSEPIPETITQDRSEKSPENDEQPSCVIPDIEGHRDKLLEANVSARMKFYAVRDELSKNRPSYEGQDQRARLAMKPCTLNCKFDASRLPDNSQRFKDIIGNIKSGIVVKMEGGEWEDAVRVYSETGATKDDLETATQLVQIIKAQEQLGATISLLRNKFTSSQGEMSLAQHLLLLRSTNIILRVGATTIHYVHWSYKTPWIINSAKLKRLERDSLPPLNAVILDLGENKSDEEQDESGMDLTESTPSTLSETSTKLVSEKVKVAKNFEKGRALAHSSKTAVEVTRQLSASCGEKTLVAIRPWVRVDGSLNRRVLDRLLGALLCHLLYNPGCTLHALQQRFCPALQPYHTFELLEILQMIGTVNVRAIHSQETVTLFSAPLQTKIEPADFTESENSIFIEPVVDAILLMAQFIGSKDYSSDFLDDIKNRPYTDAS